MTLRVAGTWFGLLVAVGTMVAGTIASLGYVFATKGELAQLEHEQTESVGDTKLRDFRIHRLEIQTQNLERIAQRTDKNVEKLLLLRRLEPGPEADIKPLPDYPSADKLWETR